MALYISLTFDLFWMTDFNKLIMNRGTITFVAYLLEALAETWWCKKSVIEPLSALWTNFKNY